MSKAGDNIDALNADWKFEGDTCKNFDEHIRKSVPLYDYGHDLVAKISDFFLGSGSVCYELGCSTGELTLKLAERHQGKKVDFIGIDSVEEMVEKAKPKCKKLKNVKILNDDILVHDFKPSDLFISYYCIQFIHPKHRQAIFNTIYESLNWGGGLLLFEKVRAPDARFQDMMTQIYMDYKLDQEYSPDEIVSKSRSLKGVLEPFSTQANIDMMKRAGFVDIMSVMKYASFEGFLAIK